MEAKRKKTTSVERKSLSLLLTILMSFSIMSGFVPIVGTDIVPAAFADPGDSPDEMIDYSKEDKVNFPDYPAPGGVSLGKTAAWTDAPDFTKAKVELAVSGQPMPQGADIVLVVDTSQSMTTSVSVPADPNHISGTVTFSKQVSPPAQNIISRQVTFTRDSVAYRSGTSNITSNTGGTPRNGRVRVTFTAYFDEDTGDVIAATGFSGVISATDSNTNNTNRYVRYPAAGATRDRGDSTSGSGDTYARNTSAGAKQFYADVFTGSAVTVDGYTIKMPANLASLPTSAADPSSGKYLEARNGTSAAWNAQEGTVSLSFTAIFDKRDGTIVAIPASGFSGVIPGSGSNRYYRYNGTPSGNGWDLGNTAGNRTTRANAAALYQTILGGEKAIVVVGGETYELTMPSSGFAGIPASVTQTSTTRLIQMKIAAKAFLDEMYASSYYIDANNDTIEVKSPHKVALVDFGLNSARLYRDGVRFDYSESTPMKTYIDNLGTTGGTNYVSALRTATTIVNDIKNDPEYDGHPIYVVFMSDGEPRGGTGSGNVVAYSTATSGTGDAANINNARIALHEALGGTSSDNGVFTVGYMVEGINYAQEWLESIVLGPGEFIPARGVADITGVFEDIARAAKKAGTSAKVAFDVMGKGSNPFVVDADGNPTDDRAAFLVDMTDDFIVKSGTNSDTLHFTNDGGIWTSDPYMVGSRTGRVVVDTTVDPNRIMWDFGDILGEEITLTYPIIVEGGDTAPNGLYFTNDGADLLYQNYLGKHVKRPFPIPQLPRPGNSIHVVYFAANAEGAAISNSGAVLGLDGGMVNTVKNIFGTDAIILDDLYLDATEELIHPNATDDISLDAGNWDVTVAEQLAYNEIKFNRVIKPEAFLIYDIGDKTYTQNAPDADNPYTIILPDASNGFIVLVGFKPDIKLTVLDKYTGYATIERPDVATPPFGTPFAQQVKKEIPGYMFVDVSWIVNTLFGVGTDDLSNLDDKVDGTMPFANVVITYVYERITTDISGKKVWLDDDENADETRDDVTIQLLQNDVPYDTRTLELEDFEDEQEWEFSFDGLPTFDSDGNEYTYAIEEIGLLEGYTSKVTDNEDGTFTVTNTFDSKEEITVTKKWVDAGSTRKTGTIVLMQYEGEDDETGTPVGTMILDLTQDQTKTFDVPVYNGSHVKYIYKAEETVVPEGYTAKYSDDTFTITNTLEEIPPEGALTVYKVLLDVNGNIIDGEDSEYKDVEFAITVTDKTDADGEEKTTEGIRHGESGSYPIVNPPAWSGKDTGLVAVTEDLEGMEGFELVSILPIYWNGDGTGQTTVINRLLGAPDETENNEVRVVKYIEYQGRLIDDTRTEGQKFGVSLTPVADELGTIGINVPAIAEAVSEYNSSIEDDEQQINLAKVVAIVSGGGLEEAIRKDSEEDGWIEFEGLAANTKYNLKVYFCVEGEDEETLYPIYESAIDLTAYVKWIVSPTEREAATTYEVIFDPGYDGAPFEKEKVKEGETVEKPADPVYDGRTFLGWFLNGEAYDFTTPVTEDITLLAKWEDDEPTELGYHTVTFVYDNEETPDYEVEVQDGEPVEKPEDPVYGEHVFLGWFLDDEAYDFTTPVTGDITLLAKWGVDSDPGPIPGPEEPDVKSITLINIDDDGELSALIEYLGLGLTSSGEPVNFESVSGIVVANDEAGFHFKELEYLSYVVKETAIPGNFLFYGMKIGQTGDSMEDVQNVNGLTIAALSQEENNGAVVVVINTYRLGDLPPEDPPPVGPPPVGPPPTTPPVVDIPGPPPPTGGYTPPPPPPVDIPEPETPLGNLPKTGEPGVDMYSMVTMGLAGLASLLGARKKRNKH